MYDLWSIIKDDIFHEQRVGVVDTSYGKGIFIIQLIIKRGWCSWYQAPLLLCEPGLMWLAVVIVVTEWCVGMVNCHSIHMIPPNYDLLLLMIWKGLRHKKHFPFQLRWSCNSTDILIGHTADGCCLVQEHSVCPKAILFLQTIWSANDEAFSYFESDCFPGLQERWTLICHAAPFFNLPVLTWTVEKACQCPLVLIQHSGNNWTYFL